ncbi:MAG: hypothetical protein R3B07_35815 [Polyangiaceae bacterium]
MSGGENTAGIKTRVVERRLKDLKLLETNARFLSGAQYQQLVANIKHDGALTSVPLVGRVEGSDLFPSGDVVLSGNHRVQAAIEAGIEVAPVLEVEEPLTEQQALGLQLSHNAITGQDDPNLLAELYDRLSFDWKAYSGLTDDILKDLPEIDVGALSLKPPEYHEISALFLPDEAPAFLEAAKAIERQMRKPGGVAVGRLEDFDRFFDALIAVKQHKDVHNTAIALRVMAELTLEALEREAPKSEVPDGAQE